MSISVWQLTPAVRMGGVRVEHGKSITIVLRSRSLGVSARSYKGRSPLWVFIVIKEKSNILHVDQISFRTFFDREGINQVVNAPIF